MVIIAEDMNEHQTEGFIFISADSLWETNIYICLLMLVLNI